ncbi:MAG: iron-containing alcohol dehydrogenase [Lentisphaerae bacterium]|nr:iron-containing alcohol dehydrogenase [Lentisphaerota bacterium]
MRNAPSLPPELVLPPFTVSGHGCSAALLRECAELGRRGVVVHGASFRKSGRLARILAASPAGMSAATWEHPGGEPTLDHVEALRALLREQSAEWVAAAGGGSVMDVAKAAAGLKDARLPSQAYHDGAALPASALPFVAVPTTAGTGSEATTVSVLTNAATGVKKSIRHPSHMARKVLLDPELLSSCTPPVLAASGMDAFTQALESFLSRHATWFTDAISIRAACLVRSSLPGMLRGYEAAAASDLMHGSYLAGIALSNARLGLVHGLAHPLGARYHAAHGLACAFCLPAVLEFNRPAAGGKFAALASAFGEDPVASARRLLEETGLSSPFAGRAVTDMPGIVAETLASGSTKANPRDVSPEDVELMVNDLFRAARA